MKRVLYLATSQKQKGLCLEFLTKLNRQRSSLRSPRSTKVNPFMQYTVHEMSDLKSSATCHRKVNFEFSGEAEWKGGEMSYCRSRAEDVFRYCQAE